MFSQEDWEREDEAKRLRRRRWWIVGGCVVALFVFVIVAALGVVVAAIVYLRASIEDSASNEPPATVAVVADGFTPPPSTATPAAASPTAQPSVLTPPALEATLPPTEVIEPTATPLTNAAPWSIDVPARDYYDVARRMGVDVGARTVTTTLLSADDIGIGRLFNVDGRDVKARLYAVTDQAYFWVDNRLKPDADAVQAAADAFERTYYPRLVSVFGREWTPGVDGDPRFSVVHLASSAGTELGFFQASNQYPVSVEPYSNQQELVYMNMGELEFGEPLYYGTLVHEVQHLVHWGHDGNETVWLDEGMAQLAELMVGLETAEFAEYMRRTQTPLTGWSYDDDDANLAHYSGSYLFSVYLWEQLGDDAVAALVRDPANGLASVDSALERDVHGRSADAFVLDWAIATLLDDPATDARYGYASLDPRLPTLTERVKRFPATVTGELAPYGVHYIELAGSEPLSVTFSAEATTQLFPPPPSGNASAWYSPPADSADASLTTELDLTGVDEASLGFWAWYDLEPGYDYAYLLVSADGGATWEPLDPGDAVDGAYGPALGEASADVDSAENGWVWHVVNLDAYVGQPVLLRLNVLTDLAVLSGGVALDGASVQLNGGDAVEVAWSPDGFGWTMGNAPVTWLVAAVDRESGAVRVVDVAEAGVFSAEAGPTALVIVPVGGPHQAQLAYTLEIAQP